MPKLLQINITANWGSTGKIAEDIGKVAINNGFESWIAYGRKDANSGSKLIKIGTDLDVKWHVVQSRLFDRHGLASKNATQKFLIEIEKINPDLIHLQNFHGYYLNYPILFDFLKKWGGPVVWTLHDCWPFTGHCAHFAYANCNKWKTQCFNCPELKSYPASLGFDRSCKNFQDKNVAFTGLDNLTLVPVSNWLASEIKESFLKDYPLKVIKNGIDLNVFKPSNSQHPSKDIFNILGVASVWTQRKGLEEFIKLRDLLPKNFNITLVGLSKKQIDSLPKGITGISRTENVGQLVDLYSIADVYVNPTFEDTFPTTNLEALACGTPVITYNTGGCPEAIDNKTGIVVERGNTVQLAEKITFLCETRPFKASDCRQRAEDNFDKNKIFLEYINLYNSILK